jgi:hypothetical protein
VLSTLDKSAPPQADGGAAPSGVSGDGLGARTVGGQEHDLGTLDETDLFAATAEDPSKLDTFRRG